MRARVHWQGRGRRGDQSRGLGRGRGRHRSPIWILPCHVLYGNQTRRDTRNATVSLSSVRITCRFEISENQLAKEMFRTLKLTARVPAVVESRRSARSSIPPPVLDGSLAAAVAVPSTTTCWDRTLARRIVSVASSSVLGQRAGRLPRLRDRRRLRRAPRRQRWNRN